MHDFVSVKDRLPEGGQECEVLRDYGMNYTTGCRFGIERTKYSTTGLRGFLCDAVSTGHVTHWRPAESMNVASMDDYPGLRGLFAE